jgi:D-alanyl-D-alanine carboxypeptidase
MNSNSKNTFISRHRRILAGAIGLLAMGSLAAGCSDDSVNDDGVAPARASISQDAGTDHIRPYAGVVLTQLAHDGRLSLDDSVERWLPDRIPEGEDVTVEEVVDHESGIEDEYGREVLEPYIAEETGSSEVVSGLIDIAASIDEEVDDSADDGYPNLDNLIASEIVEEVTGNSLREEVESRHLAG